MSRDGGNSAVSFAVFISTAAVAWTYYYWKKNHQLCEQQTPVLTSDQVAEAIKHWTTDEIKQLIDRDPAAFCRARSKNSGQTAIHWAAAMNRADVLQYIFDCGGLPSVEEEDSLNAPATHPTDPTQRHTPVMMAVSNSAADTLRFLLERGANPNVAREGDGGTAMQLAIPATTAEIVSILLSCPRTIIEPLMLSRACLFEKLDMAQLLVDHGASVHGVGLPPQNTPIMVFRRHKKTKAIEWLEKQGVDELSCRAKGMLQGLKLNKKRDAVKDDSRNESPKKWKADESTNNQEEEKERRGQLASMNLFLATVQYGTVEEVKSRIAMHPQYVQHARDKNTGWSPLIIATFHNRLEVVQVLLEAGADPNARIPSGFLEKGKGALHVAALHRISPAIVDALLSHGSDPELPKDPQDPDWMSSTPIALAVTMNHPDGLAKMLENRQVGRELLDHARLLSSLAGRQRCSQLIEAAIGDPDLRPCTWDAIQQQSTENPQLASFVNGLRDAFTQLEEAVEDSVFPQGGAGSKGPERSNAPARGEDPTPAKGTIASPLSVASTAPEGSNEPATEEDPRHAENTMENALSGILKPKAGPSCVFRKALSTSYFLRTVVNSTVNRVRALLKDNPELLHFKEPIGERTALHFAAAYNRTPTVQFLLQQGSSVNAQDHLGGTPLHLAVCEGCWSSALALLAAGANPNLTDRRGETPLELAASRGAELIVNAILHAATMEQEALNAACIASATDFHIPCVRLLLQAGADVNSCRPGRDGSVFNYACAAGHTELVKLCLEHNPDLAKKSNNMTCLDLALIKGHREVAVLIVKALGNAHGLKTASAEEIWEYLSASLHGGSEHICGDWLTAVLDDRESTASSEFCHCCYKKLREGDCYYECISCLQAGRLRRFCASCVFDTTQLANAVCRSHVFSRVGVWTSKETRKIRGKEKVSHWSPTEENKWLSVRSTRIDCFGLSEIAVYLSDTVDQHFLTGDWEPFLSVFAVCNYPHIDGFVSDLQKRSRAGLPIDLSQLLRWLEGPLFSQDLTSWLTSRISRPVDDLPEWIAILGSSDVSPLLCGAISLISAFKCSSSYDDIHNISLTEMMQYVHENTAAAPSLIMDQMEDLKVALLPCTCLFNVPQRMPAHCDCISDNGSSSLPDDGPSLRIFVSHAWRLEAHPDPEGLDWVALGCDILMLTHRMIVLYTHLRAMGIAPAEITDEPFLQKNAEELAEEAARAAREKQYKVIDQGDSDGLEIKSNVFAARILEIVAFCCKDLPNVSNMGPLVLSVLSRMFLWVDYVSLPQSVVRDRTAEENKWFKASLRRLNDIQESMCTAIMLRSDERFFSRAWCVAEYLIAEHQGCLLVGRENLRGLRTPGLDGWVQAMISTQSGSTDDILKILGLRTTNDADSDIVCRVAWQSVAEYLQTKATYGLSASSVTMNGLFSSEEQKLNRFVVAEGPVKVVINYLQAIRSDGFRDYQGWKSQRDKCRLALRDKQVPKSVLLLADCCVAARSHKLLPSLQAFEKFLDWHFEKEDDAWVTATLLSNYTDSDIPSDACIVAFPTSALAEQADFIVLHPEQQQFEEGGGEALFGAECIVS